MKLSPASSRWLLASLVLNIFLLGGIAGGAWSWWKMANEPSVNQPRGLRFAAAELTAEQRKTYQAGLRDARREAGSFVQAAREGRREVLRLLEAPQLDQAAVAAALARTREADLVVRSRYEATVVDYAATLSLEDRQRLVDGLTRRSGLGPQAGNVKKK